MDRGRNILKKKRNVIVYEEANNEYKLSKHLMREKTIEVVQQLQYYSLQMANHKMVIILKLKNQLLGQE